MLSHERRRQHLSFLRTAKPIDMSKRSAVGTLSLETTTTTSSGYSTGGSSVSTSINQSLKKSSAAARKKHHSHHQQQQQEQKTKSKGLPNLLTKLKNLLLPSKHKSLHLKPMRSMTTSRQISSSNILRQYRQQSPIYDRLPSAASLTANNTISLPFTYYYNSPIRQSRANFEKIAAWLNHTEKMIKNEHGSNDVVFADANHQLSSSSSSNEIDNQRITAAMKKNPINIKPPKRSSSLVTRITRPIIEQQSHKTLSPSSSFSSSILTKGMSERMITPLLAPAQQAASHSSKSARRRTIDFPRRRTVTGINEQKSLKENISIKNRNHSPDEIYQFPILSANNKVEMHIPPSTKHVSTNKYYFHSNPTRAKEDLLNNSYGLTLLQKQPRHSVPTTALMISQVPNQISPPKQPLTPRTPWKQQLHSVESLDDLLCDREVESYFYPVSLQSEHLYMNIENPPSSSLSSSIHGTLC